MEAPGLRRRQTGDCYCCCCCCSMPPLPPAAAAALLLLLLLHVALLPASAGVVNDTYGRRVGVLKLARIQRHLDTINKPAVRSIQSPDGDIIDCIHRHNQPALDHPLLKNHKIQTTPPPRPRWKTERGPRNYTSGGAGPRGAWQGWHHVGHCPRGTVPVRRSTVGDVLRAKSLYHFGKKQSRRRLPLARSVVDAPDVVSGNGHEHAIAYTGTSQEVYGAKATINVWDPSIQGSNEFSLSQVWILSGSFDGSDLNSIEAGWQVSPELYGDNRPRLFTYWTSDAYQATGCYNLLCSGFVQTNNKIAIGAAISPVSSYSGGQYDITILIWKDPKLGNWWMGFGDNTLVGYWPAELFTHLADHATMVEWGGEVVNMRPDGEHTSTQMGSGHFAEDGFGRASYFRNLEVVDADNSLSSAESISTLAENTNCYNIKSSSNADWGTYFYFGGPGNNPRCL
uniref:Histidinol-phosphate aminotransferase n=1 Tax=Anthurium amnicola TaxID=1678845 RepID=A0A1D1YQ58_9ARAE